MNEFLVTVKDLYKEEQADLSQTSASTRWNNTWSAMFYCGTVFTTIGKIKFKYPYSRHYL